MKGDGAIEDGILVVGEFRPTCQNGDTLTASELLIPDCANGTLINDDGRPPSTVFHRISSLVVEIRRKIPPWVKVARTDQLRGAL